MLAEAKHIGEDNSHMAHHDEAIIGRSAALHAIMDQVRSVAPTNATVLLYGETGTGKELIARAVHHILQVLRETNGVIGGSRGAAAQLGMRRTTLLCRIEKSGIPRQPV